MRKTSETFAKFVWWAKFLIFLAILCEDKNLLKFHSFVELLKNL